MKKGRTGRSAEESAGVERLPNAELEVLACLWQKGEATAAQIRDHLAEYRPMAHGSVLTLLKRLAAKRLVTRQKAPKGKAFVFRATARPAAMHRRILDDLADRVFGGNRVAMMASLLETYSPSEAELEEIERLFESLRKQEGKGEAIR